MTALIKYVLAVSFVVLSASPASALFEIRGGLGANLGDTDAGSVSIGGEEFPAVPAALTWTADALFYLPLMPLGFGARYERMGLSVSDQLEVELAITRLSAVVNYRLIDTILYLGPIATLGVAHTNSLKISGIPSQSDRTYTSEMGMFSTYSLGIEVGAGLLGLQVGGEVGYMGMNMANPETSGGQELGTDLNFTGPYAKLMVGFGF